MSGKTAGARASIIAAFNRLVLARRVLKPPVADVLSEAEVARSTFYEHFDSRDSLLIESLRAPLAIVADAAAGTGDVERLEGLLDHFREQKRGAAELLASPLVRRLVRLLAELICERAPALAPNAALRLADQQLGLIRLWITGETPCRARDLAATMAASATAQRRALADNP